jgi:hypothetical protein
VQSLVRLKNGSIHEDARNLGKKMVKADILIASAWSMRGEESKAFMIHCMDMRKKKYSILEVI